MKYNNTKPANNGFSLIEVLIGTAIFLIVSTAAYGLFVNIFRLATASQANILAVELADEQFEIIRNMPYASVGLTNGIPQGILPQTQTLTRGGFTFNVTLVIHAQNLSTSTVQASSKLVEVDVSCPNCQNFSPVNLTGQVSPANLQSAGSGGALSVTVDSGGIRLQGATVIVQSTATSSITNTDTTNKDGVLEIVPVPPGVQVYHITATKPGYSTDQTNPNITVTQNQLAMVNLSIDKLSTLNISSVSPTCSAVGNFDFGLTGAKMVEGLPKYSYDSATDGSGHLTLNTMEADTYTLVSKDGSYYASGITPISPFVLNSGSTQDVQLVVVPENSNGLLVAVQDNGTKLPLSGATVRLNKGGTYDQTYMTGQGYFNQNNWFGGSGQSSFVAGPTEYYSTDNGNVDTQTASSSGSVLLHWNNFGPYNTNATGILESATFDTGTTSNFYSLNWLPTTQPDSTSIKFQFATAPSSTPNGPWTYLGPDGTAGSYYTVPGMQIKFPIGGNEFARYRLSMSTEIATITPSLGDVSFTYTSGCIPPGQVIFQGLSTGTYTVTVSEPGYTSYSGTIVIGGGWQEKVVPLSI